MRRKNTSSYNSTREFGSSENGLFQLPSLPPWRTPVVNDEQSLGQHQNPVLDNNPQNKFEYMTPLRKSSSLLLYQTHPSQRLCQAERDPDSALENIDLLDLQSREDTEYDWTPFCDKLLLRQSKVDDLLCSERAAHCLVFHRSGHLKGAVNYRPDIEVDCGNVEDFSKMDEGCNGTLLQHVPGCSQQEMNVLLNKDLMLQRPNVRRIDEILNHETNALKKFWDGSDLTKTLERNHLHEQYLILQQEQKELAQVKATLQPNMRNALSSKINPWHPNI